MKESDFDPAGLSVGGSEYGGNLFREPLIFEFHMNRIAALSAQDLSETESRSTFKNALAGLESLLANYRDEEYEKDMDGVRDGVIGSADVEIDKSFKWFSALKRLLSRTPVYKKSTDVLTTIE
jgi:hypothetical protein